MRQFKWIPWNLAKIAAHNLSASEIEASFDRIMVINERHDASYEMYAEVPSGRHIWVIWRYDREEDFADIFSDLGTKRIFVITAY